MLHASDYETFLQLDTHAQLAVLSDLRTRLRCPRQHDLTRILSRALADARDALDLSRHDHRTSKNRVLERRLSRHAVKLSATLCAVARSGPAPLRPRAHRLLRDLFPEGVQATLTAPRVARAYDYLRMVVVGSQPGARRVIAAASLQHTLACLDADGRAWIEALERRREDHHQGRLAVALLATEALRDVAHRLEGEGPRAKAARETFMQGVAHVLAAPGPLGPAETCHAVLAIWHARALKTPATSGTTVQQSCRDDDAPWLSPTIATPCAASPRRLRTNSEQYVGNAA